ncbi:hypothetical protein RN001_003746 [Aquatica leii]|uniref:Uncharacterized protein n=1 Tax=Aquatica leii TaxID=1421715 RepID=A0AAN7ST31_9COLE|nr:hypothetical protein RN001_003746 [Aquatica leii]
MFDDLCLLREVLSINPYEDSIRWKDILAAVIKGTSKKFTLRAIKEHLQYILMLWAKEDRDNLRKSGTEEEYNEKEVLLQQVTDLSREFRGKNKTPTKINKQIQFIGAEIRNAVLQEEHAEASTDVACASIDVVYEYGDTSEIPFEFDQPKSATGIGRNRRNKQTAMKSGGLQYLREKQLYDRTLKEKEIQMENRKISCEERKIELQEKQHALEEAKFELEKKEREARLQMELEERRHRNHNESELQKIITLLLQKNI